MTDLGYGICQCRQIEAPAWPVFGLPDIFVIAAIHAVIMGFILRIDKLFAAFSAEINRRFSAKSGTTSVIPY